MHKEKQLNQKKLLITVFLVFILVVRSTSSASIEIMPEDNQYLELKATTIIEREDNSKQVIMELWGHEIDFKRI